MKNLLHWLVQAVLGFLFVASAFAHYDPSKGRWLSRDPEGEAGGFNLYSYCGNDPVNRIDPLGLQGIGGFGQWNGFMGVNWDNAAAQAAMINGAMQNGYTYDEAARAALAGNAEFETKSRQMAKGYLNGMAILTPFALPASPAGLLGILQDATVGGGVMGLDQLGANAFDSKPLFEGVPESTAGGFLFGGGTSALFRGLPLIGPAVGKIRRFSLGFDWEPVFAPYRGRVFNIGGGLPLPGLPRSVGAQTISRATLRLRYEPGWDLRNFNRKAEALQDLARRGKLSKALNPVVRDRSITTAYKDRLIRAAFDKFGKADPASLRAFANAFSICKQIIFKIFN